MSFGGGGGFGGFGQNNNQQSSGFGGFGQSTNNTTGGFGSGNTGGFGQSTNTSGGVFGGAANNNTGGGFGSASGGGFGSTGNSAFGSKPAFGSSTTGGGGLFGSSNTNTNTGSTGFGGFGGTSNANTSSPFGGGTSGGGLFGSSNNNNASKPGFGATGTTGGSLFGGGNTGASSGFGGGFGATNNPGIGGNVGDPPGTAVTPFQAHSEKEANNASQTNSYQNVLFQDAYKKWSGEELRLADYVQGRRHGNASGGGAFGVSSNFGGGFGSGNTTTTAFGSNASANTSGTTGGGLFGSNTNTNTNTNTAGGFGQTGNTGFGSNTNTPSGGLFGANKPSGGGLFGSSQNQQQSGFGSNTGGGFGGGTSTGSGFGATNTGTGGGLFGSNNQANKPQGGGLFGNTPNTGNTGLGGNTNSGFGSSTTNTGGGLFGSASNQQQTGGGGMFGNNNQQQQPQQQQQGTGGAFGGFGQQPQNQNQQSGGGGLFGNNQQKPAGGGLFGSSTQNTPSGGLFGNTNQQQQNTGFGPSTNTSTGGGPFGGAKPNTGNGLFGQSTNQTGNTGGGLFGNANQQQNQQTGGTGLFGSANTNQQQKPSLFGGSTQNTGTGMFGGQNNQNQGTSMFGGNTNQQQQNQGLGNSLLGASQQSNNAPQGLTANLNDVSAYGSPSLFGASGNEVANPGPLATPLNGNSKPKRGSILPMYKLAPASASRFATPQKRGFGFSYSTYGTPGGSPASSIASTPGTQGRSLLGSSSSGALSKSMSTNNLRRNFNTEDSILAPGAFSTSAGPRWYGSTGSKKLVISRDIRSDLFSTPQKDKQLGDSTSSSRKLSKRVSFDTSVENEDESEVRGALPAPEDSPSTQTEDTPRQNRASNVSNGSRTPDEDRSNGELTSVQEEDNSATPGRQSTGSLDLVPGEYWTEPSLETVQNMNRVQRQKIDNFVVGRENVGRIAFKFPVDISGIEIEDLCDGIIQLEPRSATVYPVAAKKPPVGKGLNVPAQITLEQSWPRGSRDKKISTDPKKFNKHVERLRRIPNTTFESYDKDSGVWVFSVEHFTTYGLDDSDDSDDDMDTMDAPADPTLTESQELALDASVSSMADEDDTFHFRRPRGLPGAFDEQEEMVENDLPVKDSFLGISSADSASHDVHLSLEDEREHVDEVGPEYDMSDNEDLTRSTIGQHLAAEHDDASSEGGQDTKKGTPGGILRARMRAMKDSAGPVKLEVADGDDWTEMLRKTVSPVKRDRRLLKELNQSSPSRQTSQPGGLDNDEEVDLRKSSVWRKSVTDNKDGTSTQPSLDKGRGFATSIDLMNSLFEKPKPATQNLRASVSATKGFPKWPYERQDKTFTIDEGEKAFHDASRPSWGPDETLVVTRPLGSQRRASLHDEPSDILAFQRSSIQTERQAVQLGKFSTESSKKYLRMQDSLTEICVVDDIPVANLRATSIRDVFHHQDMSDPASLHEKRVWELASILFDGDDDQELARKTKLSKFWAELVDQASTTSVGLAATNEEKAVACLAGHRITEACKHLVEGKNFRLATLVPLIGTNDTAKKDMREQVKAWHDSKMLSEFSEPIRAIYELLSGNVCVCEGMKGVPVEDRMDSFVISKKFGLDWKQAFGLRLWYAISQQDDPAAAVRKFQEDISQDRENLPIPWYLEQGIKPLWFDYEAHHRQDLLWGLLQLYANEDVELEAVLRPENSQLSPLDMRVCWQLGLALVATGKVSFGVDGREKADAATIAYAAQLTSAGEWLEAIFVLLHLGDPSARKQAIQDHLCRHAGMIHSDSDNHFATLTEKFRIPATWLWEALALYMRGVKKDPAAEVQCLLKAGSFVEAHRVLAQQVAPLAIIERGYADLASLMSQFQGHQDFIPDWQLGGETYSLFLTLLQHRGKGESAPRAVLDRLLAGLHAMSEDAPEAEIIRYAAVSDMADETAREILKLTKKKQDVEFRSRILKLPLTQDRLLAYSVDLGMERYREVMSH